MTANDQDAAPGRGLKYLLAFLALLLTLLFLGLGTWQVYRLQWKLDLIARVDARVHADPAPPPPMARWDAVSAESDEYRRVFVTGDYLYELTTPVQALTEEGSGYWLVTPMCTTAGRIILVNRGFIPAALGERTRYDARRADGNPCLGRPGIQRIVGLLRVSETGGPFTRANDAGANRWYSRNVGEIVAARGLPRELTAPFFVDAARGQNPPDSPDQPVGGLTVVNFHNTHLVYAITWYALALMVIGAWWWIARRPPAPGRMAGNDDRDD